MGEREEDKKEKLERKRIRATVTKGQCQAGRKAWLEGYSPLPKWERVEHPKKPGGVI